MRSHDKPRGISGNVRLRWASCLALQPSARTVGGVLLARARAVIVDRTRGNRPTGFQILWSQRCKPVHNKSFPEVTDGNLRVVPPAGLGS